MKHIKKYHDLILERNEYLDEIKDKIENFGWIEIVESDKN
jgi:hypothetical protein